MTAVLAASGQQISRQGLKASSSSDAAGPWGCLALVTALLRLGETVHHPRVRQMLEHPLASCPEVLMVVLAHAAPGRWLTLQADTMARLLALYLGPSPGSTAVLQRVLQARPRVVLRCMLSWYRAQPEPARLARLLDVAQDIKALPGLLLADDVPFVLALATLAAQRDFLNLEVWAQERLRANPVRFADPCLSTAERALQQQLQQQKKKQPKGGTSKEDVTGSALLKALQASASLLQPAASQRLKGLVRQYGALGETTAVAGGAHSAGPEKQPQPSANGVSLLPTAPGLGVDSVDTSSVLGDLDAGGTAPTGEHTFSKETDDIANSYFGQIYNRHIRIEDMVARLASFQSSPRKQEQDVFACMIRNLFDEYRFFPQYPDAELGITGVLFGSLVQHGLVQDANLGVALRYVLDALRKEPSSKLHRFGVTALGCFKDRLREWPQYCAPICAIPNFATIFSPDIVAACQAGRDGGAPSAVAPPPAVSTAAADAPPTRSPSLGNGSSTPSFGTATNINTLLSTKGGSELTKPPEAVEDKINIIFNNLSPSNLQDKGRELGELVGTHYTDWLANYIVVKRASIEPNFHALYVQLVFMLPDRNRGFTRAVLRETYANIGVLLNSQKIGVSSNNQDRSLLKNLGAWLGLQTLARNRPILQRDLGLKRLLLFAYQKGPSNLLYVIPFVAKVMEACKKSKVFHLPNPWVMAVMSTLKELHSLQNIKLTLRFEIEVLCKNLHINLADVQNTSILKDLPPPALEHPSSPALTPGSALGTPPLSASGDEGSMLMAPMRPGSFPGLTANNMASLHPYIVVNAGIKLFQQQPALAHSVKLAVERAIQEIVNPVVDRSVKIACISCHKLVGKDFAMEPAERRLTAAAHSVAQHLAGSLAMATAIDPLRASIGTHLRTLLQGAVLPDQKRSQQHIDHLIDQAVGLATPDNLNLACVFIEKTARARAVPAIDEALSEEISDRRRFAAASAAGSGGTAYRDPAYAQAADGHRQPSLPAKLRPAQFGLDERQLALYENFTRGSGTQPGTQPQIGQGQAARSGLSQQAATQEPAAQPQSSRSPEMIVTELEKAASTLPPGTDLTSLPPSTHPVHVLARELQGTVAAAPQGQARFDAAVRLAKALVQVMLGGNGNAIFTEVALLQLTALQDAYQRNAAGARPGAPELASAVAKAAYEMLGEAAGGEASKPQASPDGVARMLRARLLESRDMDAYLVGLIDQGRSYPGVVFAEELLQRCLLLPASTSATAGSPAAAPPLSPSEFPQALQVLRNIASHSKPPREQTVRLLEGIAQMLKSGGPPPPAAGAVTGVAPRGRQVGEDPEDPPGLRDKVGYLFQEWLGLATSQPSQQGKTEKATVLFITRLISNFLNSDDLSTRFFRLCADYAVSRCYAPPTPSEAGEGQAPALVSFQAVDAFVKLVLVLLRHFGEPTKVALLRKVLATTAAVLVREHDSGASRFNQKPYFRMLTALLRDVQSADEASNHQVLAAFSAIFHKLRPAAVPGFTFSWLALVSSRHFMPALLLTKQQPQQERSWAMLQALLVDLFTFLQPHLRVAGQMADSIRALYKGMLRVLLVLLHDFPEFLCAHHFSLCDAIPPACVQARNLVLSAFPRNMRLPDPFTPNLKVDLLPEIGQSPAVHPAMYLPALQAAGLLADVDNYLRTRTPVTFFLDLRSRLMLPAAEGQDRAGEEGAGPRYNVAAINALVLHVGVNAIEQVKTSADTMTHGASMDIFQHLAVDLDAEGRYVFLNAIANHLRYPNSHTHYFSCVLLHLFAEANKDVIQEQITRVLLERLFVVRPHPWGLLITFIELIKNRAYKFWSHDFVRCGRPPGPACPLLFALCCLLARLPGWGTHRHPPSVPPQPPRSNACSSRWLAAACRARPRVPSSSRAPTGRMPRRRWPPSQVALGTDTLYIHTGITPHPRSACLVLRGGNRRACVVVHLPVAKHGPRVGGREKRLCYVISRHHGTPLIWRSIAPRFAPHHCSTGRLPTGTGHLGGGSTVLCNGAGMMSHRLGLFALAG